ncbi:hypothetical protein, partial [Neisseria sp. P0013.S002]|uniref:hypothetical protein n=1 Tax=Neisseria sp. P0013.S002 TaxID=3436738 RepID=UPI003F7FA98C
MRNGSEGLRQRADQLAGSPQFLLDRVRGSDQYAGAGWQPVFVSFTQQQEDKPWIDLAEDTLVVLSLI